MSYFDIYTKAYERGYHRDPFYTTAGTLLPMIRFSSEIKFDTVLDVGCSRGLIVKCFRDDGKKLSSGIEVSRNAVEFCKGAGLDVHLASVTVMPFEDNSYEMVMSTDVLEHLAPEDVDQAIAEIVRVSSKYTAHSIFPYEDVNTNSPKYFEGALAQPHLTTQGIQWWREKFEALGCKVILDMGIANTLIFEVPHE